MGEADDDANTAEGTRGGWVEESGGAHQTQGVETRQQSTAHELLLAVITTSTAIMDLVRVSVGASRRRRQHSRGDAWWLGGGERRRAPNPRCRDATAIDRARIAARCHHY